MKKTHLATASAAYGIILCWIVLNQWIIQGLPLPHPSLQTSWSSEVFRNQANHPHLINFDDLSVTITDPTDDVCSGTSISFSAAVSGGTGPYSYLWDFGDGDTSTQANPSHSFSPAPGCGNQNYTVQLTITDDEGTTVSDNVTVSIKRRPQAELVDVDHPDPAEQFRNCENDPSPSNPTYTINVNLASGNSNSCISSYTVNWGDGTTILTNLQPSDFPLTHTYTQLGAYNMVMSAFGANNCNTTKTYVIANQSNPAGSLGTLGSTTGLCAPAEVPFTISNWELNSPGTQYILNFGDGQSVTLDHPLNNTNETHTVYHTYTTSSCPDADSYTAILLVTNACDQTPYTAGNIKVRVSPQPSFTAPITACAGQAVPFTNTSNPGSTGTGCSAFATYTWNFGDPSSGANNEIIESSSSIPNTTHTFSSPGTYTVTLSASNSTCGSNGTPFSQTICITQGSPLSAFTLSATEGCESLDLTANNTTTSSGNCNDLTYSWTVAYSSSNCGTSPGTNYNYFTNGTTNTSPNPSFHFPNPGTYTVHLTATNACGSQQVSQVVTVKDPPTASIATIPDVCGGSSATISPTASVTNCGSQSPTYLWSFPGGSPATSTDANPVNILYAAPGNYIVTLEVTNECGTTAATKNFTVSPEVTANAGNDITLCNGSTPLAGSGSGGTGSNYTYSWSPTSGLSNPNIATPTASPSVTTTYTMTVSNGNCSDTDEMTVYVNTIQTGTLSADQVICTGEDPLPFTEITPATAAGSITYQWESSTTNATTGFTDISGATNATYDPPVIMQTTWYRRKVISTLNSLGCTDTNTALTVTLNTIDSGSLQSNQTICSGGIPTTLSADIPATGIGTLSYQWENSTDNISFTEITGATGATYTPAALTQDTWYRRKVTSTLNGSSCTAISNVIAIRLTTPPSISEEPLSSQTLCAGASPETIHVTISGSGAGYTYQWYSNSNNSSTGGTPITGANQLSFIPPTTTVGTTYYYIMVSASGAGCEDVSTTAEVIVIAAPTITQQPVSQVLCEGDTPALLTINYQNGTGTPTYQWYSNTVNSTTGGTAITGATNLNYTPPATLGTLYYYVVMNFPSGGCSTLTSTLAEITLHQLPVVTTANAQTICSGDSFDITPLNNAGNTLPAGTQYTWTIPSGSGFSGGTAQTTPIDQIVQTLINTTDATAQATYTITPVHNGCLGVPFHTVVTLHPKPVIQDTNLTVCSDETFTFSPVTNSNNQVPTGTTYAWSQPTVTTGITGETTGSDATEFSGTLHNATDTDQTATYTITPTWDNGTEICQGDAFTVTVTVTPEPVITPLSITVCSGANFEIIPLNGSDGIVPLGTQYSWVPPTPPAGVNGEIAGAGNTITGNLVNTSNTSQTLNYTVTPSFNGCEGDSFTAAITVVPLPTVEVLPNLLVCNGDSIGNIEFVGTVTGTVFNWSNDTPGIGTTPSGVGTIPSFTATNNSPIAVTATLTVTPEINGCFGNPIAFTITINPAPIAEFSIPDQTLCSGTTSAAVSLTSTTPNADISWIATIPTGITGAQSSGTTSIPIQTLVNSTNTPLTVLYTASALTADATACPGATTTYQITVTPVPYANDSQSTVICSANPLNFIPADGGNNNIPTGTLFTWSSPTGSGFTGGSAQSTPQPSLNQTLQSTSNVPVVATYTLTPEYNGCVGVPFDVTVTVNPTAVVPNTALTVCSGEAFSWDPATVATILPANTTFSWNTPAGSVTGGTGDSNQTMIQGTLTNTGTISEVATYTITPLSPDGNCAGDSFELTVTVNPEFTVTSTLSNYNGFGISSDGANDGFINLTPNGGTANYSYQWTGPSGFTATTQNINNLEAGDYTVTISDGLCTDITLNFTLIAPLPMVVEEVLASHVNVECYGNTTGSLEVLITQVSIAPFDYVLQLDDGTIIESVLDTNAENYLFENLPAGLYDIQVTDANGTVKYVQDVEITQPDAPLTIDATLTDFNGFSISCHEAQDASIDLTITGGTPGYTFSWTGPNGFTATTEDVSNLTPGTYEVLVYDSTGSCFSSETYLITEPDVVSFTTVVSDFNGYEVACNGGNRGSIDITPLGGTGSYTYTWSGTNGFTATTEDIQDLSIGTYTVYITDTNGCSTATQSFTLTEPTALSIAETHIDVICFGDATGSIDVTLSGGTPGATGNYSYSWTGPNGFTATNEDLVNIIAGTYELIATDANGCSIPLSVTLTQQPEIIIIPTTTPISCYGADDATLSLAITGGNPPYIVNWDNLASGTYQDNLGAGNYGITVTDASNCQKTIVVNIPQAPIFTIYPEVHQISCYGANDGSIALNLVGGQAPVVLEWSDGSTAGTTRNNLPAGTYTAMITDGTPCQIVQTFIITEPNPLSISAVVTDALTCNDPLSGSIDLIIAGGMPPYTYNWSNGQHTEDLNGITNGTYAVEVIDANGCGISGSYTIHRPDPLYLTVNDQKAVDCEALTIVHQYTAEVIGGIPPYSFAWSSGTVSGTSNEQMTTSVTNGTVLLTVTDGYGCTQNLSFEVQTAELGYAEFEPTSFSYVTHDLFSIYDPITFENLSTGDYTITAWNFGDGNYATAVSPIHTYGSPGTYLVTLTVQYPDGCESTFEQQITITEGYRVMIPSGFTPNGDGINDYFVPAYTGVNYLEIKIFDTWGALIYAEKGTVIKGWDGNLSSLKAENGNYYYHITGETFYGKSFNYEGAFTLLN